jgi:hypothetical protein
MRLRRLRWTTAAAAVSALALASAGGAGHDMTNVFHLSTTNAASGTTVLESAVLGDTLRVRSTASSGTAVAGHSDTGGGVGVTGTSSSNDHAARGVLGRLLSLSPGNDTAGVYGSTASTTHLGPGVYGVHMSQNGASPGVLGVTSSQAPQAAGVLGEAAATTAGNFSAGVRARNLATNNEGTGLWASHSGGGFGTYSTSVGNIGVWGLHTSSSGTQAGVQGTTLSSTNLAAGVFGEAPNGSATAGVIGNATSGIGALGIGGSYGVVGVSSGLAGLFLGNVHVNGTLSKSAGSFRIDHPLEPETKYLQHSFVESPDMKNVYDGVVRTDRRGLATVRLPRYFEALNRDFRYQLTLVGKAAWGAQAVVWEKIRANRFVIRSRPRVEVSWQVTGIRKDAYANANRIRTEVAKADADRATFRPATLEARLRKR